MKVKLSEYYLDKLEYCEYWPSYKIDVDYVGPVGGSIRIENDIRLTKRILPSTCDYTYLFLRDKEDISPRSIFSIYPLLACLNWLKVTYIKRTCIEGNIMEMRVIGEDGRLYDFELDCWMLDIIPFIVSFIAAFAERFVFSRYW